MRCQAIHSGKPCISVQAIDHFIIMQAIWTSIITSALMHSYEGLAVTLQLCIYPSVISLAMTMSCAFSCYQHPTGVDVSVLSVLFVYSCQSHHRRRCPDLSTNHCFWTLWEQVGVYSSLRFKQMGKMALRTLYYVLIAHIYNAQTLLYYTSCNHTSSSLLRAL